MSAGTTRRAIRIGAPTWAQFLTVAHSRGENPSELIRKYIERYIARHSPKEHKS